MGRMVGEGGVWVVFDWGVIIRGLVVCRFTGVFRGETSICGVVESVAPLQRET